MAGRWKHGPAAIGLLIGLFLVFYSVIFSLGDRIPGDMGDARFINFVLEHSYRWAKQEPLHQKLWNFPMFFPETNTGAYSDILVSAGPFYWGWRVLGCAPETAFQLWLLTVATLNYLLMYGFLTRCFRFGGLPSAFGAFFFAFAQPRVRQIGHSQLWLQFYTVICCYALYRIFERGAVAPTLTSDGSAVRPSRLPVRAWIAVFFLGLVAQLYASFYLGWFLVFGLGVAALWAIALPRYRQIAWTVLRRYAGTWLLCSLLAALLMHNMTRHYSAAVRRTGWQGPEAVLLGTPTMGDWLSRGDGTFVNADGFFRKLGISEVAIQGWPSAFRKSQIGPVTTDQGEHAVGVGIVTSLFILVGLFGLRHRVPGGLLLLVSSLTILLFATRFLPRTPALWQLTYRWIPAGGAIRVMVRVAFLLLVPAAVGLASFLQQRQRIVVVLLVVGLCILEQTRGIGTYSKAEHRENVARVVSQVTPGHQAFFYAPLPPQGTHPAPWKLQIDAMWAQFDTGIPTVNGYSGKFPPGWWPLYDVNAPDSRQHLDRDLAAWLGEHHLTEDAVCIIQAPLPDPLSASKP